MRGGINPQRPCGQNVSLKMKKLSDAFKYSSIKIINIPGQILLICWHIRILVKQQSSDNSCHSVMTQAVFFRGIRRPRKATEVEKKDNLRKCPPLVFHFRQKPSTLKWVCYIKFPTSRYFFSKNPSKHVPISKAV